MRWNPYINGFGAVAYIWGVVLLINHIASLHHDSPDNLTGTASALSLLVLSAAVMAFLFFYRPVALMLENRNREAISFLLKTIGIFAALTLLVILTIV